MNILFICDEYPPGRHGGIGTVVQTTAREMVKQGHNVIVAGFYDLGYGGEDEFDDEGVKVYRFRRGLASGFFENAHSLPVKVVNKLFTLTGIFQWDIRKSLERYKKFVEQLIERYNIEIIENPDYIDYVRFCKQPVYYPEFSKPTIVKLHGTHTFIAKENKKEVAKHIFDVEQNMLDNAEKIVSVSKYGAEKVKQYFDRGFDIEVIHNGLDLEPITKNIGKEKGKVLFSGTLHENKGIYKLLSAWNLVVEQNSEAELWIYGRGPIDELKKMLSKKALDRVHFEGFADRPKLLKELSTATVCVLPSFVENFALAPMEAMASGAAVIYTKTTSGSELIEDGVDGVLVDPHNPDEIALAILKLLSEEDMRNSIAEKGKKKIFDKYSISVIVKQHIDLYQEILNS